MKPNLQEHCILFTLDGEQFLKWEFDMRTTWFAVFLALVATNLAHALSPLPPLEVTLYLGIANCPARPAVIQNAFQNQPISITLAACGVAPTTGTLSFTSSDPSATLPAAFAYNFLTLRPGPIIAGTLYLRTPGVHTLVARDAANTITASETFNVSPVTALLEVGCVSLAIAVPPLNTIAGKSHPLSVLNCGDTATPILTLESTDPAAMLPMGPRTYPPSLGVPESIGSVTFQTPGLRVVRLRGADGTLFATFSFNVLADQMSVGSQAVPANTPLALAGCALLIAALGVAAQKRIRIRMSK